MAYVPGILSEEYNVTQLQEELEKIANTLQQLDTDTLLLIPQHVEPERLVEGMVVVADGTDWDPGSGAGIYEYVSGAWAKL